MSETASTTHGRLLEALHIAGYTVERATRELKWLLEEDRWKKCGDGFDDIDKFVATLQMQHLKKTIEERKEIVQLLSEKRATQRAIAEAVGVGTMTVNRDLKPDVPSGTKQPAKDAQEPLDKYSVPNGTPNTQEASEKPMPPSITRSPVDVVKTIDKKHDKAVLYGHDEGDEWYTPRWLFDSLGVQFAIDVCAPEDLTHVTTPADRYFNQQDDGLAQPWAGTVWCNPPYSAPEAWATKCIEHGDALLLTHIPMNAEWCARVWDTCDGIRLFQAIEFVRPDGKTQRPGSWLQLAAFGARAKDALSRLEAPTEVAENPRRVPSPMWVKA